MNRASGRYHDGASAAQRDVVVECAPEGLRIVEPEDGREIAFWRCPALRMIDEWPQERHCGRPVTRRGGLAQPAENLHGTEAARRLRERSRP